MTADVGATRERRRLFRRPRSGAEGTVRIDVRTKNLVHRLKRGEIAIILHEDLDQLAAEALVDRRAAAVINCHRSVSGRYPNQGPLVLARAGIPLIDAVGETILEHVREGDRVRIAGGDVYLRDERIATGIVLAGEALERVMAEAELAIGDRLEGFVRNTMDYLQAERGLVLEGAGMPDVATQIAGRDVVVVVRGKEFRRDLQTLRGYIADIRPILIAVDGAADALIEEGYSPDIIIGDMDSVSTGALTCGAEIVVHAYPDGTAPGLERLQGLGIEAKLFPSAGTSEDIALLLAFEKGADLIVAVGAHDNLVDFLDKGRGGMASTFLVRLKVGARLVDARGVNRLYHSQVRTRDVVLLVSSALAAMITAGALSPGLRLWLTQVGDWFKDVWRSLF